MRRREFVAGVIGGAAAWPIAGHGQQHERMRRIGVLSGTADDVDSQDRFAAFRGGLQELGWNDQKVTVDTRYAAGDPVALRSHARELVQAIPDVLLANSTPATAALQKEAQNTPIAFINVVDPVGSGFIETLGRPGRNLTGLTNFEPSLAGKWLHTLKEVAPQVERIGVLFNPITLPAYSMYVRGVEAAAGIFRIEALALPIQEPSEIGRSIIDFAQERQGALLILPDITTTIHRGVIVATAARERLPALYPFRLFTTVGGLMSYGIDASEAFREAASYIDRIFRGTNPSELPVRAPTKYELAINLKAANALGLTVPPSLLARADEVIE